MTIAFNEWKANEIKKMTEFTQKQIIEYEKLGIKNTVMLRLMLITSIQELNTRECLIWFLNNRDKINN
jgi:hypothetical protein